MIWLLRIALRDLVGHTRRTLLLGSAIAAVTFLLTVSLGLVGGVRSTIRDATLATFSGHLNVGGVYKADVSRAAPVLLDASATAELFREKLPGLQAIVPRGRGFAKVVSHAGSIDQGLVGVELDREPYLAETLSIEAGRLSDLHARPSAVIFQDQAKKLDVDVGDDLTIYGTTLRGAYNAIDVRVAAIAKNQGILSGLSIIVSNQVVRELFQYGDDAVGAFALYFDEPGDLAARTVEVKRLLSEGGLTLIDALPEPYWERLDVAVTEGWTGQRLDVTTWEDESAFVAYAAAALEAIGLAVTFLLLLIVMVGFMNSMWVMVRERTRDIGTLRSIGMSRLRVAFMFGGQALLLGLLSSLLGAVVGLFVGWGLGAANIQVPTAVQLFVMSDTLPMQVSPGVVVLATLTISAAVAVTAFFPSMKAARLTPATALSRSG